MSQENALPSLQDHPRQFASAFIVFGRTLKDLDTDKERKERKTRVLERRLDLLRKTIPEASTLKDLAEVKATAGESREQAVELFVDVAFCVPFAPYEVDVKPRDYDKALYITGNEMKFGRAFVDNVLKVKADALGAHSRVLPKSLNLRSPWTLVVAGGLAAAALVTVLPALIGSAAGLAGAAALSHGLAVLGGGSLAMGGFGMAGGMWVLAGLGTAAVGSAGVGAYELVRAVPVEVLRLELAKSQTTVVLRIENGSWTRDEVLERLKSFDDIKTALQKDLEEEKALNDKDASRIRTVEDKVEALDAARAWILKKVG